MLVVFGSINMDFNFNVNAIPQPGETVLAPRYDMSPGGKGANQALAAARAGAKTALIGKVGDDGMGQRILMNLRRNEVMTSGVARSENLPTGMASVIKDAKGENVIVVASGANSSVKADQAPDDILHDKNVVLMQMEVPLVENLDVMKRAKECGAHVVLNLAPAIKIPPEALRCVDTLIVNQIEARQLAESVGLDANIDLKKLALAMSKLGDLDCIITLGGDGVVAVTKSGETWLASSMKLDEVVDTTGSGDCFCGTFAAYIHEKKNFADALHLSVISAGLACTKEGTQDSYPYSGEVEDYVETVEYPKKQ
ncbi:MAG: ribokinase [Pseudomonadota bacterium]